MYKRLLQKRRKLSKHHETERAYGYIGGNIRNKVNIKNSMLYSKLTLGGELMKTELKTIATQKNEGKFQVSKL